MFDLADLRAAVAARGRVARVVVAAVKGSTPREAGTAMLVWEGGITGTIGGGSLEWEAIRRARAMLSATGTTVTRAALGPALNQCCGGAVTLVTEVFDAATLPADAPAYARRVEGEAEIPGPMKRSLDRAAALGTPAPVLFSGGWLAEPLRSAALSVVIYGAGHVGQALAVVLDPLPGVAVTLADDREPADIPTIYRRDTDPISQALSTAPDHAHHFVMTHSHALDLDLCHRLLSRQFGAIGLIGSETKWARFRKRLIALGHAPAHVDRIDCPIGDPALGKHPQAIALGVATALLRRSRHPARIEATG